MHAILCTAQGTVRLAAHVLVEHTHVPCSVWAAEALRLPTGASLSNQDKRGVGSALSEKVLFRPRADAAL